MRDRTFQERLSKFKTQVISKAKYSFNDRVKEREYYASLVEATEKIENAIKEFSGLVNARHSVSGGWYPDSKDCEHWIEKELGRFYCEMCGQRFTRVQADEWAKKILGRVRGYPKRGLDRNGIKRSDISRRNTVR